MTRHQTIGITGGRRFQSAVPTGPNPFRANGLILRGVVMASYVPVDGPDARHKRDSDSTDFVGVHCDVLVYARHDVIRSTVLHSVPVAQNSGIHSGHIWKPRAATVNMSNAELSLLSSDPKDLDGDHVLVQFIDDDIRNPIITGRISHPQTGKGNRELQHAGHRHNLQESDGDVDFIKHHGAFYGIDNNGNFLIDTTRANDGTVSNDGEESPKNAANYGNVHLKINKNATLKIECVDDDGANPVFFLEIKDNQFELKLQDGSSVKIENKDGNAKLTLGDGAQSVSIAEELQTWFDSQVKVWLAGHTHIDGFGGTGPPVGPPPPSYVPSIASSKLKIPAG